MTAQAIANPLPHFTDSAGLALAGGYVYFGAVDTDPRTSPIAAFFDEALTIPAEQPLRTQAGYLWRNGAPANVWVNSACSVLVLDAQGRQVFYAPNFNDPALSLRTDLAASGGSALVGFLQAGAGAVLRTEQAKMRDVVSLKDFGAIGDDVANDTAAVNAWLTYISTNGKTGVVPAGKYRITSKVTITGTTNFSIIGEGQELSQFIFEGGDVGFDLYAPSRTDANGGACVFSMFSILKKSDASTWGGTALKITTGTEAAGNPSITMFLHALTVGGAKGDATTNMRFTHGIRLKNCLQAQLSNVFVVGAIPLNTSAVSAGIWFEDSTGCRVVNMHCFRFQRGYYVSGSTEGPTLTACHAVGTQDGIVVDGPSTTDPSNPGLDVSKSHFNVMRYAIRATNRAQGIIEGCLFYEFLNTTETVYKAIWTDGVSRMWVISGNVFTNRVDDSAPTKYAIHWDGTNQNQINNNVIRTGGLTYGIMLGANTDQTYVLDNAIDGMATPANAFVNNATDKTSIRYRSARSAGSAYNTWGLEGTALAIPNNTATLLAFTTLTRTGEGGMSLADSTTPEDGAVVANARMVVPEYATRIRVTGGLSWDANATGTRTVETFLNGVAIRGLPAIRVNASSALSSQCAFASSPIDVVSGDRITIKVTQTSGASLSLQNSTRCYATVEVLA